MGGKILEEGEEEGKGGKRFSSFVGLKVKKRRRRKKCELFFCYYSYYQIHHYYSSYL